MQRLLTLVPLALLLWAFEVPSAPAAAAGLVRKPRAEILWDRWGTPHIYAAKEEDAFRAFGWAQMESHGNLLLKLYGQGRGRAAEYFGVDFVASDRAVKAFGLYALSRKWYAAQSSSFRRNLDSFATGINEYAKQNPQRLHDDVKAVLPVDGADVMAHSTRVLYLFLSGMSGVRQAFRDGSGLGSNAWAIAPSRSAGAAKWISPVTVAAMSSESFGWSAIGPAKMVDSSPSSAIASSL